MCAVSNDTFGGSSAMIESDTAILSQRERDGERKREGDIERYNQRVGGI